MSELKNIVEATEEVRTLRQLVSESSGLSKKMREAENRLAFLSAVAFVTVSDGKTMVICGVSRKANSNAMGLIISPKDGGVISVVRHLDVGAITIRLRLGGQASFTVSEYHDEDINYDLRVFSKLEEAEDHQNRWCIEHTSR